MKKIFTIFSLLITIAVTNAQSLDFYRNYWYLKELNLSNSEKYDRKQISIDAQLVFWDSELFQTNFCKNLVGVTGETNNSTFNFSYLDKEGYGGEECLKNNELKNIDEKYLNFFINSSNQVFSYTITNSKAGTGDIRFLEIVNSKNQKALFSTLSIEEESIAMNTIEFTVYPNPVSDVLYVKSTDKIKTITIYSGNTKVREVYNTNRVNVKSLKKGVYYVAIFSENGRHFTNIIKK